MTPTALIKQLREGLMALGPSARILYRTSDGRELPIAKVKMRGDGMLIVCEGEYD